MRFRPCIDLRNGKVVQIVGGTLNDDGIDATETNFESDQSPESYALRYKKDGLDGGHVIALGPGNEDAALASLRAFPNGLQYGGGVNLENAARYLDAGASHVIVTSFVFSDGKVDFDRLRQLVDSIGKERLVLDLSCRKRDGKYWVVTNRWSKFTDLEVSGASLDALSEYCDEFLVHGVDVEGRMAGIEEPLVSLLGQYSPIPTTYAGGAKSIDDLERVKAIGQNRVDLTIGSALDIFGGSTSYEAVLAWQRRQ